MIAPLVNPMGHVTPADPSLSVYLSYFKALLFLTGIVTVASWLCIIVSVRAEVKAGTDRGHRQQPVTDVCATRSAKTYGKRARHMVSSFVRQLRSKATTPESAPSS